MGRIIRMKKPGWIARLRDALGRWRASRSGSTPATLTLLASRRHDEEDDGSVEELHIVEDAAPGHEAMRTGPELDSPAAPFAVPGGTPLGRKMARRLLVSQREVMAELRRLNGLIDRANARLGTDMRQPGRRRRPKRGPSIGLHLRLVTPSD